MIAAQLIQKGKGKGRDPWLIRAYLGTIKNPETGRAMNMSAVAILAETYPQVVQETVKGIRNHERTLKVLEDLGCPYQYLYGENPNQVGRAA